MIIDSSALLTIFYEEEEAASFRSIIARAPVCRMSAANFLETAINLDAWEDAEIDRQLDNFVRTAEIEIVAVTLQQAQIARQAYRDFGKGRHKAKLNYGDCFAYALARETDEPLLFKGNDFAHTDVTLFTLASSNNDTARQ